MLYTRCALFVMLFFIRCVFYEKIALHVLLFYKTIFYKIIYCECNNLFVFHGSCQNPHCSLWNGVDRCGFVKRTDLVEYPGRVLNCGDTFRNHNAPLKCTFTAYTVKENNFRKIDKKGQKVKKEIKDKYFCRFNPYFSGPSAANFENGAGFGAIFVGERQSSKKVKFFKCIFFGIQGFDKN